MEEHRPGRAVKDSGSYFQPLTLSSCLFLGNVVAELKVPPKKAQRALKNLKASHADLWHDEPCHSTLSQPLWGLWGSCLTHPAESGERSTFPHQQSRETKCIQDRKAAGGHSDELQCKELSFLGGKAISFAHLN